MALQTSASINGFDYPALYIAITNSRVQKLYPKDEAGNQLAPGFKTWIYINAFANAQARVDGKKMLTAGDHVIMADGELSIAEQYAFLKTQDVGLYNMNLTTATDI